MKDNLACEEERWEEVIDGKIVMMSPASMNHNRIAGNIFSLFNRYLKGRTCEAFSDGAALYLTDSDDYYIPDVMVVCDPNKVKDDGVHGAPDLVVEILSPGTTKNDRGRKKDDYEKYGVKEYWIVEPANKTVEQYILQDGKLALYETYSIMPDWMLARMKPEAYAAVATSFKCCLYDDLTIRLEDIFARVP